MSQARTRSAALLFLALGGMGLLLVTGCRKAAQTTLGGEGPPTGPGAMYGQQRGYGPPGGGGTGQGPGPGAPGGRQGGAPAGGNQQASAGLQVYQGTTCSNCHMLNGQGGQGGQGGGPGGRGGPPKGPDLSHVGAKRDARWIADHVRDPKVHNQNSRMPRFGTDKISDQDLQTLAGYLASLK